MSETRWSPFAHVFAASLFVAACGTDPSTPTGGASGSGGQGGISGAGGGSGEPDFAGFTVAPPLGEGDPGNDKTSVADRLAAALESTETPSSLAGAFYRLSRAYLSGRAPANDLESSAFDVLDDSSPEVRDAIARTLDAIDALPSSQRHRLYPEALIDFRPVFARRA